MSMDGWKMFAWMILVGWAWFGLTACGGTECGEGTTEQDGTCVTETSVVCAEGTSAVDGTCYVGDDGCAEGTQFDSESGTCIAGPSACSEEGTTFDSETGTCIAVTECGGQTRETDDGTCVPDHEQLCPSGARDGDGECVPCSDMPGAVQVDQQGRCTIADAACGDGTMRSAESGTCVLAESACGDGLALGDDATCQPTSEVCGDDASFDEDEGLCLPDQTCQSDDVVVDGVCVSEAEQLASDESAVEETENNDPRFDGSPNSLSIPSNNDPAIFTGTIAEPIDLDGDGNLEQDRDVFEFSAAAGDWFKIELHSTGLDSPFFFVEGPNGYQRWAPSASSGSPARFIVAPSAGDYTVTVLPRTVTESARDVGPIGSSDSTYVGAIQKLVDDQLPTASSLDLSSDDHHLSGSAEDLTDNYFELTNLDAETFYQIATLDAARDADLQVQIWSDATTLERTLSPVEAGVQFPLEDVSGSRFVLVDWIRSRGPDRDFDFEARWTGHEETVTVDTGATGSTSVDVDPFTRIRLEQSNSADEDVSVEILDANGDSVHDETVASGESTAYLAEQSGSYDIDLTHEADQQLDLDLTVRTVPPRDLGTLQRGETRTRTVEDYDGGRMPVKFTIQQGHVGAVSPTTGGPNDTFDAELFDSSVTSLKTATIQSATESSDYVLADADAFSLFWYADQEATFYGVVEFNGIQSFDDFDFNGYAVQPQDLGTLQPGDSESVTFSPRIEHKKSRFVKLDAAEDLGLTLSGESPRGARTELVVNDDTVTPTDRSDSRTARPTLERGHAPQGSAFIEVRAVDPVAPNYDLDIEATDPPIQETEANNSTGDADAAEIDQRHIGAASTDDEDFWQIDLGSDFDDEVLSVHVPAATISDTCVFCDYGWTCELQDDASNTIVEETNRPNGCHLQADDLDQGTYYLRISNTEDSAMDYEVFLDRHDGVLESEGNNTVSNANTIDPGLSSAADIFGASSNAGDTDYFAFDLSSDRGDAESMIFELERTGPYPAELTLELLDDQENTIDEGRSVVAHGLDSGTYYLAASGGGDTVDGDYRIHATTHAADQIATASPDLQFADDSPSGVDHTISTSNCSSIDSTAVLADIGHAHARDLQLELTGPSGQTVTLQYASQSTDQFTTHLYPATHEPDEDLSVLNGESGNGDWSLHVSDRHDDDVDGSGGTLASWGVKLTCQ